MAAEPTAPMPVPITAPPKADQLVEHDGAIYRTIKEGAAHILVPSSTSKSANATDSKDNKAREPQSVFYNPIQQFNRDLSVLAIKAIGQDLMERRSLKINARAQKQKRKENNKRRKANDGSAVPALDGTAISINERIEQNSTAPDDQNVATTTHEPNSLPPGDTSPAAPVFQFRILDALSATGLRALRYAHEIEMATQITANDLLQTATDAIRLNVKHNKLEDKIKPVTSDARAHMYAAAYAHGLHEFGKYHVVDLDPYGTAAPFLDAAIEAVHDGGMLCVTCTDAGVFASCGYLEKTFALYGGLPIKGQHSHEGGLRLILNAVATTAARYGKSIEPLLSLSIDFYARVFVRVQKSPENTKLLAGKTALVQQCDSGCGAWTVQPIARNHVKSGRSGQEYFKFSSAQIAGSEKCAHCGFKTHLAGPMWMGPLHNPFFISKILSGLDDLDRDVYGTVPRIQGMLTSALDELDVIDGIEKYAGPESGDASAATDGADTPPGSVAGNIIPALPASMIDHHPFHFNPSALSKVVHCVAPSEAALKGALRHMGYVATRSHTKPGAIKTQAPWSAIWHVMREWTRQKAPVKMENQKPGSPGWEILGLGKGGGEGANGTGTSTTTTGNAAATTDDPDSARQTTRAALGSQSTRQGTSPLPEVVFDIALGTDSTERQASDPSGKKRKLVRYQSNPRANWGPMARASASR